MLPLAILATNQTIEINLNLEPEINPCNLNLTITTNKNFYETKEKILFCNNLSEKIKNFEIEYHLEENNIIIKKQAITKNLLQKSYTPSETKEDRFITIHSRIISPICATGEIKAEKSIIIKGNPNLMEKTAANKTKTSSLKTAEKQISQKTTENLAQFSANTQSEQIKNNIREQKQSYQIKTIPTETLLNNNKEINLYEAGEEKARNWAKYILLSSIVLFIIGKKNGNKNKNNNRNRRLSTKSCK